MPIDDKEGRSIKKTSRHCFVALSGCFFIYSYQVLLLYLRRKHPAVLYSL